MPRFSVVIPAYNGERYLEECLSSLIKQTFTDFEIICIDDASTDESALILEKFSEDDFRVRVISQKENTGSARARRRGVLESRGEYILFSDQDDSYNHNAFWTINFNLMRNNPDILQYEVKVINDSCVSAQEIEGLDAWMKPYPTPLKGREILDKCFIDNAFGYSIWNKAYKGDIAREVFAKTPDEPITLGEDNYEYFVLFYASDSYESIPHELYEYHYGRGYTGNVSLSVEAFKRTCGLIEAAELIKRFLKEEGAFEEYEKTYSSARNHMLEYALERWYQEIEQSEKVLALKELIKLWPYVEVLELFSRKYPELLACLFEARFDKKELQATDKEELRMLSKDNAMELLSHWERLEALSQEYLDFQKELTKEVDALKNSKRFKRGNSLVSKPKRK